MRWAAKWEGWANDILERGTEKEETMEFDESQTESSTKSSTKSRARENSAEKKKIEVINLDTSDEESEAEGRMERQRQSSNQLLA